MYNAIEKLLKERIGLDVSSVGVISVHNAIKRCLGSSDYEDIECYYQALLTSESEFRHLIDAVVIPETWFFRDGMPFEMLVEKVKKHWSRDEGSSAPIKILSIPCSTGEEPYTIAIALDQIGFPAELAQIDAIDISQQSLDKAQQGVYRANSFRSDNLEFRDRYFTKMIGGFQLESSIKDRVNFKQGNLLRDDFSSSRGEYDVVFCRNLLIYFDNDDQRSAVRKLRDLLKPDGILFVGHAEANNTVNELFQSLRVRGAFSFVKKDSCENCQDDDYGDRLSQFSKKHGALILERKDVKGVRAGARRADAKPFSAYMETGDGEKIQDHKEAVSAATKMADEGRLDEAEALCNRVLEEYSSADAYYLLGVICEATDRSPDAEIMYRKAIYLMPDHVEALVHLALHLERNGNEDEALSLRRRAGRAG